MRKKTSKLKNMEKNRYSIITNDLSVCYICKRPKDDLHEIYSGAYRKLSMVYGAVLPLCRECHCKIHNDNDMALKYKKLYQTLFEQKYTRDDFIKIFKKNYL